MEDKRKIGKLGCQRVNIGFLTCSPAVEAKIIEALVKSRHEFDKRNSQNLPNPYEKALIAYQTLRNANVREVIIEDRRSQ